MDSRFFREDNPYNMFMNTVGDLAMLSVAWAVCSLPIVTIGRLPQTTDAQPTLTVSSLRNPPNHRR